jgi:hypothetical protein
MTNKRAPLELVQGSDDAVANEHPSAGQIPSAKEASPTKRDSERPAFDPFAFAVLTVPPNLRREMLQGELPRLEPEYFQDTIPPNLPLEAPSSDHGSVRETGPAPVSPTLPTRRHPPVAVVVACLLAAAALLLFASVTSVKRAREAAPSSSQANSPPVASTPASAPAVVSAVPVVEKADEQPPTPSALPSSKASSAPEAVPPTHPAHPVDQGAPHAASSKPSHPAPQPAPVTATTAAPAQTSWIKPR